MKLLLIEDNLQLVDDIASFLTDNGFVTETTDTMHGAEEKIGIYEYDVVILDLGLPDGDGLNLIPLIQEQHPETEEEVFKRFRKDNRHKSLGLGLAIVKKICEVSGLDITYSYRNHEHTFVIKPSEGQ